MASTVTENIKVTELSKFGFKVGTEYVNYSKQLAETDKTKVVPGAEFQAELYVADSGKRYLNKILSVGITSLTKVVPPMAVSNVVGVDADRAKKFTPKFQKKEASSDTTMSKADWAAKDRSQLVGGLSHDAAQLTLAAVTTNLSTEQVLKQYKEILDGVVALREGVK